MNQTRREQGNIIVYVVIGVVLLGLLAGGIYLAKNQARVARDGGTEISTQAPADESNETAGNERSDDTRPDTQEAAPEAPATDRDTQDRTDSQTVTPPEQDSSAAEDEDREAVPATGPSTIASTGPEDFLGATAVLAVLIVATVAYLKSHHQLHSLK